MTGILSEAPAAISTTDRLLRWAIALLVVAQAAVVGLQVVGRHILRSPIPWTEEVARLLLVWLMCVGGVSALRHAQHPRVTALMRLLSGPRRSAAERGLRLVLLAFFLCLVGPAYRLTVASASERLPASGLSGAAISIVLPAALLLMCAVLLEQLHERTHDEHVGCVGQVDPDSHRFGAVAGCIAAFYRVRDRHAFV